MIDEQLIKNPAGFWIRLGASLLDGLIIGLPIGLIAFLLGGEERGSFISYPLSLLYSVIVPFVWSGYTIGKRIAGIRIAKVNGEKVGIGTMLLRTVAAYLVYLITFGIGFIVSGIMVMAREDKRSIHDFIAGTYVTRNKPEPAADPYQPQPQM